MGEGQGLREDRLVRVSEIVGDREAKPPVPGLLPICEASWWDGVRKGKYPKPIKLGPRVTCWRLSEVMHVVHNGPLTPQRDTVAA
jgi:prophage regulatory protein